ncbi:MAG: hypothetical protein GX443_02025 [Deltaproteobacteria bacterium]|nr:hypothetical protein [Deltaproteobacteria bacterium]
MNGLEALFNWMSLVKMSAATSMVMGLSLLAEKLGPRTAGILSGFPLGVALTLFFVGVEQGPHFAAQSAVFTTVGLIATQSFAYAYYRGTLLLGNRSTGANVVLSSALGVAAYFGMAWLLRRWEWTPEAAVAVALGGTAFFAHVFSKLEDTRIEKTSRLTVGAMLARGAAAALFVVCITSFASMVGPRWAGLFSAFPITMLPFVVIMHCLYRVEHVHTILKHVPRGIASIIVYALAVLICYPRCGIVMGTVVAYAGSTLYLLVLHLPNLNGGEAAEKA